MTIAGFDQTTYRSQRPPVREHAADFLFSNIQALKSGVVVSEDWFSTVPELTAGNPLSGGLYRLSPATIRQVAMRQGAHPDGWLVRRSILQELNGFWTLGAPSEDYELFARILDRANGVLYRALPTVAYRLPEGDAVSLKFSRLEEHLQIARNALHLRATCRNRWALRCSRPRRAGTFARLHSSCSRRDAGRRPGLLHTRRF